MYSLYLWVGLIDSFKYYHNNGRWLHAWCWIDWLSYILRLYHIQKNKYLRQLCNRLINESMRWILYKCNWCTEIHYCRRLNASTFSLHCSLRDKLWWDKRSTTYPIYVYFIKAHNTFWMPFIIFIIEGKVFRSVRTLISYFMICIKLSN